MRAMNSVGQPGAFAMAGAETDTDACIRQARELRRSDPAAALSLVQTALAAALNRHDAHRTAACQLLCAELHFDLSDYDRACVDGAEALAAFEQLDDTAGRIDSQRVVGRSHEKLGHDQQAQAHLGLALELSLQAGEHQRAGFALLSLGHVRHNAGDFSGSIPLYRRALELAQPLGDAHLQGMAESGLANAFARMGDYARALAYHQRCLLQFDAGRFPREHSFILNNIANIHFALEDHRSAIDLHEQSLELKRRLKDRWGEGTSLHSLGKCYGALGELDRAQAYFESSLHIAQAIGDREGECLGQQDLGDLALQQGRLDEAMRRYEAGLQLSHELGRRYNEVMLLYGLGRAYRLKADLPQARERLEQALRLTGELQVRREEKQIHDELAALHEFTGELAQALAHVKQAYRLERDIFSEDLDGRLRHLKLHFELEKAEQEKELHRLRHVELARVNEALERSNADLAQANAQKEKLLAVLERQKRQLERQSTRDALTGLANRRLFDQQLARSFRTSKRHGHPLSVVLCDIDNFKAINDRYSHQTGDAVLQMIGRLLTRHCRKPSLVARYGGEEFALLLSNTPGNRALARCEKIRRVIAGHDWARIQPGLVVTLSMGIADDLKPDTHSHLLALADQRLYQAKHGGKNRVVGSS
jgi:diguanylate cyclase (GGDEF)-like protein